jgi:hypothetical protein
VGGAKELVQMQRHYLASPYFLWGAAKPICPPVEDTGVIRSRIASKTTLNWLSNFFSICSNFRASSVWLANMSRSLAKMESRKICAMHGFVVLMPDPRQFRIHRPAILRFDIQHSGNIRRIIAIHASWQ